MRWPLLDVHCSKPQEAYYKIAILPGYWTFDIFKGFSTVHLPEFTTKHFIPILNVNIFYYLTFKSMNNFLKAVVKNKSYTRKCFKGGC